MHPFTFFISYRRKDTGPVALLLKNEIEKRLQFVRVFVDVSEMGPGEIFPERLRQEIRRAHVTIVLIGPAWMPKSEDGSSLDEDNDWVKHELELSKAEGFEFPKRDSHGLKKRRIIPLFVNCEKNFSLFKIPAPLAWIKTLNAESIDYASWPVAIGPLIDSFAVALNQKKRPDADEFPPPDPLKARTQPVGELELFSVLSFADYDGWYVDNFGNAEARYLTKIFKFPHFDDAAEFMKMVSEYCRVLEHHPEWRNVFNHVTVALTTWDARRRVTIYDLNLALFMNKAAKVCRGY